MVFVEILAILIVFVLYYVYKDRRYKSCLKNYNGPPMLPIVGNLFHVGKDTSELHQYLLKYNKEYGPNYVMNFGILNYVLVSTDHEFLEFLLNTNAKSVLNKTLAYKFTRSWLGNGLLTADADKWRHSRKIINPAFHFKILENFVPIFDKTCQVMTENLSKRNDLNSIDIHRIIALCSLDIICETAMGATLNAQQNEELEYVKCVKGMCRVIINRALSLIKAFDTTYRLTRDYYKEKQYLKVLHGYTNTVINERRKILAERNTNEIDATSDEGIKRKVALMDLLLTAKIDGKPMSQGDIAQEIDTFLFAGHDTTTAAISFAIYLLSKHPEVQQQAFDEQKQIFEDNLHRPVALRDLQEMKYLDMIIKETLRLYPSVPLYSRELSEDVEYKGNVLPKGLSIFIFSYGLHRNEECFPEPEVFNPNRFDDLTGRSPCSYLPFSTGPRNCIGQKFAIMEIKTVLSHLIRSFEITAACPSIDIELAMEVVLVSKNGINVGLKKR